MWVRGHTIAGLTKTSANTAKILATTWASVRAAEKARSRAAKERERHARRALIFKLSYPLPVMKSLSTALAVIALSFSGVARAQCDPYGIDLWLASGPSISAFAAVQNEGNAVIVAPLVRVGFFAGLPVQFELSTAIYPDLGLPAYAAAGARVLPVSVSKDGMRRGGLPGHNLGAIGGWTTLGWYWGAVYEWLLMPEMGVVAEIQWALDDIFMTTTTSFHLGAKFQVPTFRDDF